MPQNCYCFVIGKTYSIDDHEMTNVFNMLDHALTNMIYVVIQIYKPQSSAGEPEHFRLYST